MISKVPNDLNESLKEYLHKGEKVFNAIEEVYVLNFDFRWILLTSERIILATKRFFDYNFKDYILSSLDMDVNLGFFFDVIDFRIPAKTYAAHFYRFNRFDTLKFFHEVEKKIQEQKNEDGQENKEEKPGDKLRDLKKLFDEGIISEKEYKKKKKELLDKL